jgi:hypothetical protein
MPTTTTDIDLSAQYSILTTSYPTRAAEYSLLPTMSPPLPARYALFHGTTSLTKSAAYVLGQRTSLYRAAVYHLRMSGAISLSAYYVVAKPLPVVPEIRRFNLLPSLLSDSELPISFSKDAQPDLGITLHYTGGEATVTILRHRLMTSVDGGPGVDLIIDLSELQSMQDLVNEINASTGYTCTLTGAGDISPMLLIPVEDVDINTTTASLLVFTSLLWKILIVAAWALEDSLENVEEGLEESAQPTSDTNWLDQWGVTLGDVLRLPLEPDPNYKARMMREVQRIRLGKNAIINAVLDAIGVQIDITYNQHALIMVMGSPMGTPLIDRLHIRPLIYIYPPSGFNVDLFPALMATVDRNRAAGIEPIYGVGYDVRIPAKYSIIVPSGGDVPGAILTSIDENIIYYYSI